MYVLYHILAGCVNPYLFLFIKSNQFLDMLLMYIQIDGWLASSPFNKLVSMGLSLAASGHTMYGIQRLRHHALRACFPSSWEKMTGTRQPVAYGTVSQFQLLSSLIII